MPNIPEVSTYRSNNPPSAIEAAAEFFERLSAFLADHPVVSSHDDAKEFKTWVDRARMVAGELEDERKGKVQPLNDQVRDINAEYKATSAPLERLVGDLKGRVAAYLKAEEDRRRQEAIEAERRKQEAISIALAKEAEEKAARENAEAGEVVDLGGLIADTDAAFHEAEEAINAARRAERDAENTRIGGGFGRAASLRNTEVWTVTDAVSALVEIGVTAGIEAEIIKAAKAWKRLHGRVPAGCSVEIERKL